MSLLQQKKPYFLTEKPPPGYVAGVGRGATGFTTRSDLGMGDDDMGGKEDEEDFELQGDKSESNFDENDRLFATGEYDAEDKEADLVWASFDDYMDARRKRQREEREEEEMAKIRAKRPKLQSQFADAKKALASVSFEEWATLPESGNSSSKAKAKAERYTPVPDSLLEQAHKETQLRGSINAWESSGKATPGFGAATPLSDVQALGTARKTMLGTQLENASKSVISGTASAIQTAGYLSSLDTTIKSSKTIGDTQQNRMLLESATASNPTSAPSWISLARLEEEAGRLKKACKVIEQACINCPKNKDVWLEAARLNPTEPAKSILARAIQHLPDEIDIWIAAANLEVDIDRKKRVFKKALERLPTSAILWKEAVDLEEPEEAKLLLNQAVKCVPHSAQMWLALAHLETYERAKTVLNNARKAIPTEKLIWLAAAQLEEANGNTKSVKMIISKAIKSLEARGVTLTRDEWLKEAERCEQSGSPVTCQAIVEETIGIGLLPADCKSIWREDATQCIARGSIHTARSIYTHACYTFKTKKSLWRDLALLEKKHGTREKMLQVLEIAVEFCPASDLLWLMAAKEEFSAGNIDAARKIIAKAYQISPSSEQIWLAAAKVEQDDGKFEDSRGLLKLARQKAPSGRVWMKSAMLERLLRHPEEELRLLQEGVEKYPTFAKLWMMLGQYYERLQAAQKPKEEKKGPILPMAAPGAIDQDKARLAFTNGLKHCPGSVPLWLCAIRYDEKVNGSNSARALCERGRLKVPKSAELWTEAVRIERRANQLNAAKLLCSRALQQFPSCGLLWVELIEMEVKTADKAGRFSDAFKQCDNDPNLIAAGARIFAESRKIKNAREWFERAVKTNGDYGDVWAAYYKFELQHGTPELREALVRRCVEAAPRYGEHWISVTKNPENFRITTEEALKQVALLLP